MLVTTGDLKADYHILGLVRGNHVKAAHLGRDIIAFLRSLIGGEVKQYVDLLSSVRDAATADMIKEAEDMGANGIIGVRYASSQLASGMAEILAYGTAVKY